MMNSTLENRMDSTSILPTLHGHKMPGDVHDFMARIGITDGMFLKVIKGCMQYLEQHGVIPADLAVQPVIDIEEPDHKYLRVLFVLPMRDVSDAIKLQTRFHTEAYRRILSQYLGEKKSELDAFRRRVNIVFDIEAPFLQA